MGYYEDKFRDILRSEGVSQKEFSQMFSMNYDSLRRALWRGGSRWVRAFVMGYSLYGNLQRGVEELNEVVTGKKIDPSGNV